MAAPDDAPGAKWVKPWGPAMVGLGAGIVGLAARDNGVTSEQVKEQKEKSPTNLPLSLFLAALVFFLIASALGCSSPGTTSPPKITTWPAKPSTPFLVTPASEYLRTN